MHVVSWWNYILIMMPQFALVFAVQSVVRHHRVNIWLILGMTIPAILLSLFFTTAGEAVFGVIYGFYLYQRRRDELLTFLALWSGEEVMSGVCVAGIDWLALIWPHALSWLNIAVPVGFNLLLWLAFSQLYRRRKMLLAHLAALNQSPMYQVSLAFTTATAAIVFGLSLSFEWLNMSSVEAWLITLESGLFAAANLTILYYANRAFDAAAQVHDQQLAEASRNAYYHQLEVQQQQDARLLHDYKNILATLRLSLKTPQADSLLTQAERALSQNGPQAQALDHVACLPLRNLLYLKWTQAQTAKHTLLIETQGEIDIQPDDLVMPMLRGVGILVDNALEALQFGGQAAVLLVQSAHTLTVTVLNPVPDTFTLADLTHTTKGAGHGNGLANIRQLCQDPRLNSRTQIQNGQLAQSLILEAPDA